MYQGSSKICLLSTKRIVNHIHNKFAASCTCAVSVVILASVVLFIILKTKTARITTGSADHTIIVAVYVVQK